MVPPLPPQNGIDQGRSSYLPINQFFTHTRNALKPVKAEPASDELVRIGQQDDPPGRLLFSCIIKIYPFSEMLFAISY
jgi:hypothetical protein